MYFNVIRLCEKYGFEKINKIKEVHNFRDWLIDVLRVSCRLLLTCNDYLLLA